MASNVKVVMNPWEVQALNHHIPDDLPSSGVRPRLGLTNKQGNGSKWQDMSNSVFFPGLYSASGYDLLNILLRLVGRPNPQIALGPVDCSVALILCDLELPDEPIVYVTDAFCDLTGYSKSEVMGRNCRFLQKPNSSSRAMPSPHCEKTPSRMRQAIRDRQEIQLKVVNYRKNGQRFYNMVSIIPVDLDGSGCRYAVGFSVEVPP